VNACAGVHENYLSAVTEEGGARKFFKEREELVQKLAAAEAECARLQAAEKLVRALTADSGSAPKQEPAIFVQFDKNGEFVTARYNTKGMTFDCDARYVGYYDHPAPPQAATKQEPVAYRVADGEGGFDYAESIKDLDPDWQLRVGRKIEPLCGCNNTHAEET